MSGFRHLWPVIAVLGAATPSNSQAVGPLDDPQNCQPFDDSLHAAASDRNLGDSGLLAADDFTGGGSTLSQVRVWGFYIEGYIGGDCGAQVTEDQFRVRVFQNDPGNGRSPDAVLAHSMATSQRIELAESQIEATWGSVVYQFDLTLEPAITGLVPGEVYWLEVSNGANFSGSGTCIWLWNRRNPISTSYSWLSMPETGCVSQYPVSFDQAFCTNFVLEESPVGSLTGACCTCDGLCAERTLKDCDDAVGVWDVERTSCSGVVCDTTPSNDNCADGPPLIPEGFYTIPKKCTTTDGYGPIATELGQVQIEGDVWYKFIASPNCEMTIDTCSANAACFDSILAVYHNPEDPGVCPPCALMNDPNGAAITSATLAGQGQDESCPLAVTPDGGWWWDLEQLGRHPVPGECFLIRVGNYPGSTREVDGLLHVDCGSAHTPPPLEPDPTGINKTRFISFTIPTQTVGQTAIRIQLTALHHVPPSYIEGPPAFTAFEGMAVYAGPPTQYVESTSTGIPFQASIAQCTPHYRDWSTLGLLHVTGSAIVPSSTYHVEQMSGACQGVENSAPCQSGGGNVSSQLQVKTTRWGDVETPFNPPTPTTQPDVGDISALVNKFKSAPGAPIKARALLGGVDQFGTMDLAFDLSFAHISACVDAFLGLPYPFKMGKCASSTTACRTNFECGSNGPCNLYCP